MEDWYTEQGLRRLQHQHAGHAAQPAAISSTCVIPELQRRGLFKTEYAGRTLRERMGLPTPQNPYFTDQARAAE